MPQLLQITKAFGDENRVRAFFACLAGELCVCQITELLKLAPSTISQHLSILKDAGLLESCQQGRWVYYRMTENDDPLIQSHIDFMRRTLKTDRRISEDAKRLKAILKMDPEELCHKQKASCCSPARVTLAAAAKSRKCS